MTRAMLQRGGFIVAAALALAGCRADIAVDGTSVRDCGADSCPEGLRCYAGHCVVNTPPALESFGAQRDVPIDAEVVVTAVATDPENDPIAYTWSQVSGPTEDLFIDGPTLTLTPRALGLHVFSVSVDDGFIPAQAPRPTAVLTLLVQPAGIEQVLYVAQGDNAQDSPSCGTSEFPCRTISGALNNRTGASAVIMVAVAARAYEECLDLDGDVAVMGDFNSGSWDQLGAAKPLTTIECVRCAAGAPDCGGCGASDLQCGHHLVGASRVQTVELTSSGGGLPGSGEPVVATLWLEDSAGSPHVEDVDIAVAVCGGECIAAGVATIGSNATLRGVNVAMPPPSLTVGPPDFVVGLLAAGGGPTITGDVLDVDTTPPAEARGIFELSASSSIGLVGILSLRSALTTDAISVRTGRAIATAGVVLQQSAATIDNTHIRVIGAGTRQLLGVQATPCAAESASTGEALPCFCDQVAFCAAQSAPTESNVIRDTRIEIDSDTNLFGLQACSAIGADLRAVTTTLQGGSIHIGSGFSTSLGVALTSPEDATAVPTSVAGVTVRVGDGVFNLLCVASPSGLMLFPGSAGIAAFSGHATVITDNDIRVGSHDLLAAGVRHIGGGGFVYRNNRIVAGASPNYRWGRAIGAWLVTSTPPSEFSANLVGVGSATHDGTGLTLSPSGWHVVNNGIYGGDGWRATGFEVASDCNTPSTHPRIVANTIVAGGLQGHTGTARGLVAAPCTKQGLFANNLVDGGRALGHRSVLDLQYIGSNPAQLFKVDGANVVQTGPDVPPPMETPIFVPGSRLLVLRPRAGRVSTLNYLTQLENAAANELPGPVSSYARRSRDGAPELTVAGAGWIRSIDTNGSDEAYSLLATPDQPAQEALLPRAVVHTPVGIIFEAEYGGVPTIWRMLGTADRPFAPLLTEASPGLWPPSGPVLFADGGPPTLVNGKASIVFVGDGDRLLEMTFLIANVTLEDVSPDGLGPIDVLVTRYLAPHTGVYMLSSGDLAPYLRLDSGELVAAAPLTSPCVAGKTVCGDASAISLYAGPNSAGAEMLAVGCDDGAFEIYRTEPAGETLTLTCSTWFAASGFGADLADVAIREDAVIATAHGDSRMQLFDIGGDYLEELPLITDTVQLQRGSVLREPALSILGAFEPATACPIAAHDGVTLDDPHLVSGGGDCVDGGETQWTLTFGGDPPDEVVSAPSTDLYGQSRDATPDIGADELGLP